MSVLTSKTNDELVELMRELIQEFGRRKADEQEPWRWKPKEGEEFYFIRSNGLSKYVWNDVWLDFYKARCVFKDCKIAERCHERQVAERAIVEYVKWANDNFNDDVGVNEESIVCFHHVDKELFVSSEPLYAMHVPKDTIFKHESLAFQAIKDIGHHYKTWFGVD